MLIATAKFDEPEVFSNQILEFKFDQQKTKMAVVEIFFHMFPIDLSIPAGNKNALQTLHSHWKRLRRNG